MVETKMSLSPVPVLRSSQRQAECQHGASSIPCTYDDGSYSRILLILTERGPENSLGYSALFPSTWEPLVSRCTCKWRRHLSTCLHLTHCVSRIALKEACMTVVKPLGLNPDSSGLSSQERVDLLADFFAAGNFVLLQVLLQQWPLRTPVQSQNILEHTMCVPVGIVQTIEYCMLCCMPSKVGIVLL